VHVSDDPEPGFIAGIDVVTRNQSPPIAQGLLIAVPVILANLAPVAGEVPLVKGRDVEETAFNKSFHRLRQQQVAWLELFF
jgi:hypothetical protein